MYIFDDSIEAKKRRRLEREDEEEIQTDEGQPFYRERSPLAQPQSNKITFWTVNPNHKDKHEKFIKKEKSTKSENDLKETENNHKKPQNGTWQNKGDVT